MEEIHAPEISKKDFLSGIMECRGVGKLGGGKLKIKKKELEAGNCNFSGAIFLDIL